MISCRLQGKRVARMGRMLQPSDTTILVVDDDPEIRDVLREYLEDFGYRVLIAENGSVALRIIACDRSPHLVITDIRMPEMSGLELAERIARERGDVKVIFMSGFTWQNQLSCPLLRKPFRLAELEAAVRTELTA